jgi:protein CMS1
VGTPARIKDLLDDGSSPNTVMADDIADFLTGALATDRLERIVIDCSYIDQKKKGILETKETQIALIQLLGEKQLRERYNSDPGSIDLLFF